MASDSPAATAPSAPLAAAFLPGRILPLALLPQRCRSRQGFPKHGKKLQRLRHLASQDGSSPEPGHPHARVLTHPVPVFRHLVHGRGWAPGPRSGHLTQAQSLDGTAGALGHPADDKEQAGCRAAGAGAAAGGHGGQRLPLLLREAEPFHRVQRTGLVPCGRQNGVRPPAALPAPQALPFTLYTPLMPQPEPLAVASPQALGCRGVCDPRGN